MVAKIKDLVIIALFLLVIVMTIFRSAPCPEPDPVVIKDTVTVTKVEVIEVPGPTEWRDTIIYKFKPSSQRPAPEPVPQVINAYSDTLLIGDCEVAYDALVHGELISLNLRARRTSSRVIKITDTQYIRQEVEKKITRPSLYIGGGLGGNKDMLDDITASIMYTNRRNGYALDYDLLDRSVHAKIYFKIF